MQLVQLFRQIPAYKLKCLLLAKRCNEKCSSRAFEEGAQQNAINLSRSVEKLCCFASAIAYGRKSKSHDYHEENFEKKILYQSNATFFQVAVTVI